MEKGGGGEMVEEEGGFAWLMQPARLEPSILCHSLPSDALCAILT